VHDAVGCTAIGVGQPLHGLVHGVGAIGCAFHLTFRRQFAQCGQRRQFGQVERLREALFLGRRLLGQGGGGRTGGQREDESGLHGQDSSSTQETHRQHVAGRVQQFVQ